MKPQDIIKKFMHSLDKHSFKTSSPITEKGKKELVKRILDQSIAKNSQFKSIEDLVNNIVNDCKIYNDNDKTFGYKNFLKEKCGIELYNEDTGAISGSDANIIIDSNTIGSGIEKSDTNIIPEYGNYYEVMTNSPQKINTGDNGWIIKCGPGNDTIISNGEDSICSFAGTNYVTLSGSNSTIDAKNSKNNIFINDNVKSVVLINYDQNKDTLSGNTEVIIFKNENEGIFTNINNATLTSDYNIKNIGVDNYFNIDGISIYNENNIVEIDLNKAIDEKNPKPVGAFIINNNKTNFIYDNGEGKKGKIVGHIASIYPQLMSFSYKGLKLKVKNRVLLNGTKTTVLKTFSTFNDVGIDTDYTFQNTYKNKTVVSEFTDSDTGNEYEKYIVASIYKWWLKEGLKLAKLNYDISFEDNDATVVNIDLTFKKTVGGSNNLAAVSWSFRTDGPTVALNLIINKDYYETLNDFNDVNGGDIKEIGVYLDRTICHEFTHAIMAAKINYFSYLPKFIMEGTAELAHGIDDKRTYSIITLSKNSDLLEESLILTEEYGTADYQYAGGYIFFRYFAKQASIYSQNSLIPVQVHPIVNLKDNINTNYYIENLNIENPYAVTSDGEYVIGSAQNNTYVLSDNFEQIINTDKNSWNISINTINNTIQSNYGNDNITISGGDNQYLDFINGDNNVVVLSGNNHTIKFHDGTNNINVLYQEVLKNNNIYLGNGNGNATLCGEDNILYTENGTNTVHLFGTNNTIISGSGNDVITSYTNSPGGNIYLFKSNDNFGTNLIENFKNNDIINIDNSYDVNISDIKNITYVDNNNTVLGIGQLLTIFINNNNKTIGSIEIATYIGNVFNKETNLIYNKENNDTPEPIKPIFAQDIKNKYYTKRNIRKYIKYRFNTNISCEIVKEKISIKNKYYTKRLLIKKILPIINLTKIIYVKKYKYSFNNKYIKNINIIFTKINIRKIHKKFLNKFNTITLSSKNVSFLFINTHVNNIINIILKVNTQRYVKSYKKPIYAFIINQRFILKNKNQIPYSEFRNNN